MILEAYDHTMGTKNALFRHSDEIANNPLTPSRVKFSDLSIKIDELKCLDGNKQLSVQEVGDGSIIRLFDKTPFPKEETDVVCPHFLELKWANGCNFNCAWCYLNGTFRFRPHGKKPYLKDKDKITEHIKTFLQHIDKPALLNSGELSDSLVFEGTRFSLTNNIIPLFKEQKKHKLLILTKSDNISDLIKSESQDSAIISFTVNASEVSKKWEHKAPPPENRLKAAKKLFDKGYTIRLRIDPIVPINERGVAYTSLVDSIFSKFTPERITLGSLRGLQSTINNSQDTSWVEYLDESSNWGKKISLEKRTKMYKLLISYLRDRYDYKKIALCKETISMWKTLGLDYKKIRCNCTF